MKNVRGDPIGAGVFIDIDDGASVQSNITLEKVASTRVYRPILAFALLVSMMISASRVLAGDMMATAVDSLQLPITPIALQFTSQLPLQITGSY